jgi:hypothetical protein
MIFFLLFGVALTCTTQPPQRMQRGAMKSHHLL